MTRTLSGIGSTPLAGLGTARWYRPDPDLSLPEQPPAADIDTDVERDRVATARERVREAIRADRDRTAERVGESEAEVFDAHVQFLDDPQLVDAIDAAIADGSLAEHAVDDAFGDAIAQFEGMDGRMAERADDLRDIRDRLLRELLDVERASISAFPDGTVVLAERLTPSDTADLDPDAVAGLATVLGGRTSHAAIIARSLAIPAVVGVGEELRDVGDGSEVVVDGETGEMVVDPTADRREAAARSRDVTVRDERVETADGRAITVAANVGSVAELDGAATRGADGIGLFRTEFLFLDRRDPPDEAEQYEAYVTALDAFPGETVVVRTLDVGGDKRLDCLPLPAEDNPFLGRRGIRLALDEHAEAFETQLRALCRAAAHDGGDLAVMFPMIATVGELEAALDRVEAVTHDLEAAGIDHAMPELGAMVETPAAAWSARSLAERVEFLSIGTNDLTQYVMAADREHEGLAALHDPLHPPVLRAIAATVEGGHEANAWVGMCGEMAGDPDLTPLLVGLGLDELSASPVTVPAVKARIEATNAADAASLAERALAADTREDVRALLADANGDEAD